MLTFSAARNGWVWVVVVEITFPALAFDTPADSDADATPTAANDIAAIPPPVTSIVVILRMVLTSWCFGVEQIRSLTTEIMPKVSDTQDPPIVGQDG